MFIDKKVFMSVFVGSPPSRPSTPPTPSRSGGGEELKEIPILDAAVDAAVEAAERDAVEALPAAELENEKYLETLTTGTKEYFKAVKEASTVGSYEFFSTAFPFNTYDNQGNTATINPDTNKRNMLCALILTCMVEEGTEKVGELFVDLTRGSVGESIVNTVPSCFGATSTTTKDKLDKNELNSLIGLVHNLPELKKIIAKNEDFFKKELPEFKSTKGPASIRGWNNTIKNSTDVSEDYFVINDNTYSNDSIAMKQKCKCAICGCFMKVKKKRGEKGFDCDHYVELDHSFPKARVNWFYIALATICRDNETFTNKTVFYTFLQNLGGAHANISESFVYICTFCNQTKSDMIPYSITKDNKLTVNKECLGVLYTTMLNNVIRYINGSVRDLESKDCSIPNSSKCIIVWIVQWIITYGSDTDDDKISAIDEDIHLNNILKHIKTNRSQILLNTEDIWNRTVRKNLNRAILNYTNLFSKLLVNIPKNRGKVWIDNPDSTVTLRLNKDASTKAKNDSKVKFDSYYYWKLNTEDDSWIGTIINPTSAKRGKENKILIFFEYLDKRGIFVHSDETSGKNKNKNKRGVIPADYWDVNLVNIDDIQEDDRKRITRNKDTVLGLRRLLDVPHQLKKLVNTVKLKRGLSEDSRDRRKRARKGSGTSDSSDDTSVSSDDTSDSSEVVMDDSSDGTSGFSFGKTPKHLNLTKQQVELRKLLVSRCYSPKDKMHQTAKVHLAKPRAVRVNFLKNSRNKLSVDLNTLVARGRSVLSQTKVKLGDTKTVYSRIYPYPGDWKLGKYTVTKVDKGNVVFSKAVPKKTTPKKKATQRR